MIQMPLSPPVALLALALALSGCALNQPRPPMPEGASTDDSAEVRKLLDGCKALWESELTVVKARHCASDLRRAYMHHDRDLSRAQGTLDRSLLAVAAAGVATATFGSHPDTTAALGLIGGTVGGVRGYYNANGRMQAMSIGRSGMNCILESSAAIEQQAARIATLQELAQSDLTAWVQAPTKASRDRGEVGTVAEEAERVTDSRQALAEVTKSRMDAMAAVAMSVGSRSRQERGGEANTHATDDPFAELIRQAIQRVSEQVIGAYTFGAIEFKSSGAQIRQAVDDALEITELAAETPPEAAALINPVKRATLMLVVDTARLNACGRSGD